MTEDPPDDETPPDDDASEGSRPPESGGTDDPSSPDERETDDVPPADGAPEDSDPAETADRSDSSALFGTPADDTEGESGADDADDESASVPRRKEPTVPTATESESADAPSTEREREAGGAETEEEVGALPDAESRSRVESALTEVRRECWKAAGVHAVTEGAVVFLAVNLLFVTLEPSWLPERIPLPEGASEQLVELLGGPGSLAVPGSAALAVALGVVTVLVGVAVRVRRPLVEQFEAANPPVREALRTARDAVGDDADSAMARRLYADVLDRLGESSGLALVDGRRIGLTVVVAVVLAVATVQVAVLDPGLFEPPVETDGGGPAEAESNYTGLLDGDQILGDSEAVEAGEEELNASIESSGGGQDVGEQQQFPADSGPGTGASGGGVDSQQAGFAAPDQVEDAELVREYNRRIRSGDSGGGAGGADGSDGGSDGSGGGGGSDSNQDVDGDNT